MASSLTRAIAGKLALLGVFFATAAGAQTTAPRSLPAPPPPAWTVAGGYESFWLRDIAQGTRPVDASPVAWEGQGPAIVGNYAGNRHHVGGSFSSASSFALESPVKSLPTSSDDRARRLTGRYEYRWCPFRNVGVNGLEIGFGIEGDADHLMLLRHFQTAIELRTNVINFGAAGVVAIRLSRSKFDLQAAFGNGLSIGRSSTRHLANVETSLGGWGGGWQTNLDLRAAVRVRAHTSVVAAYLNAGEGRFASHDSFTFGRSRFSAGVTYER
jgi:hypothetical protein